MDMDLKHGHGIEAWTWTIGHAACTGTLSMDIDIQNGIAGH
jgi:hypothetical protein